MRAHPHQIHVPSDVAPAGCSLPRPAGGKLIVSHFHAAEVSDV
jgi:hypothetical protein